MYIPLRHIHLSLVLKHLIPMCEFWIFCYRLTSVLMVFVPFTLSVTSCPCSWSYSKTFFQLLTCLCTIDKRPKKYMFEVQALCARVWNHHICIPHIHLKRSHCIMQAGSTVRPGFTEWHQGFSKMLFELKLPCNTWWYFITVGQPSQQLARDNSSSWQDTEEQIKREL